MFLAVFGSSLSSSRYKCPALLPPARFRNRSRNGSDRSGTSANPSSSTLSTVQCLPQKSAIAAAGAIHSAPRSPSRDILLPSPLHWARAHQANDGVWPAALRVSAWRFQYRIRGSIWVESQATTSPSSFCASQIPSADFPDAVGPTIATRGEIFSVLIWKGTTVFTFESTIPPKAINLRIQRFDQALTQYIGFPSPFASG